MNIRAVWISLFVVQLSVTSHSASANIICDGNGCTSDLFSTRTIHRLTRNKVKDANPIIAGDLVYWERFGGDQGDTEIFTFDIGTGDRTRLTKNKLDDTLQSPGVWISSPPSAEPPFGVVFDLDVSPNLLTPSAKRDLRRHELFKGTTQITKNRRQEKSVRVAEKNQHGMAWLSRKIPYDGLLPVDVDGFDVFRYNGRNRRTTRLTDTPNATDVAFGGPWVVWTTTNENELMMHHVYRGETRSVAADTPFNIESTGNHVKYETFVQVPLSVGSFIGTRFANRIRVYDALTDTMIEIGEDPDLGFHRDASSVMSDGYVAYNRSLRDPFNLGTTGPVNPLPEVTELRLFDLDTLDDILVTEGSRIGGIFMDDDTLVWHMLDKSSPDREDWDLEIFAYDLRRGRLRQVTDNNVDDLAPQVSGGTIVWTTQLADGNTEIYAETYDQYVAGTKVAGYLDLVDLRERFETFSVSEDEVIRPAVAAVPEPAALACLSITGLSVLGRRRTHRRAT